MVVDDFNVVRAVVTPDEAHTPLVVDANAVLPLAIALQHLQLVDIADIVLAADDESLAAVRAAADGALFAALRAGIRSGHIVCYMLKRRCLLEERGFDELLDALGFAFMGACR